MILQAGYGCNINSIGGDKTGRIVDDPKETDTDIAGANITPEQQQRYMERFGIRCVSEVIYHDLGDDPIFGPEKAIGPPMGAGKNKGSLDVFVIGDGGMAVFDMGGDGILDGAGTDLKVFENGFRITGTDIYSMDLGYIEVSPGGTGASVTWPWYGFPEENSVRRIGIEPVVANAFDLDTDPFSEKGGGDGFDLYDARKVEDRGNGDPREFRFGTSLSEDGIGSIRYVKVVDGDEWLADNAAFSNGVDIDAICGKVR